MPPFFFFCSCVCLLLCSLSFFALVVFLCPLALSLWVFGCGCCFLFPFGLHAKRKGAKCFPCVLFCSVVGCFIWLLLCIPRTLQVSARLYRNKVLEKGNLNECSKLSCALLCSYLYSSKFVLFLFSYRLRLFGSCFLFPFRFICLVPP